VREAVTEVDELPGRSGANGLVDLELLWIGGDVKACRGRQKRQSTASET
jgi:hypothetical protein